MSPVTSFICHKPVLNKAILQGIKHELCVGNRVTLNHLCSYYVSHLFGGDRMTVMTAA